MHYLPCYRRAGVAVGRFVNSDFTVDYPAPIQPDTVLVGGFAVDRAPAGLPAELEQFVAESGDAGLVVASFGTLVRQYGPRWTSIFTEAFSRLPQRVVWRHYGNETTTNDTRWRQLASFHSQSLSTPQCGLHINIMQCSVQCRALLVLRA